MEGAPAKDQEPHIFKTNHFYSYIGHKGGKLLRNLLREKENANLSLQDRGNIRAQK